MWWRAALVASRLSGGGDATEQPLSTSSTKRERESNKGENSTK